jgi:hypothetical protein
LLLYLLEEAVIDEVVVLELECESGENKNPETYKHGN